MSLVKFFKKYWIQSKIEDTQLQDTLPKTNISNYEFSDRETRIYTIEIYNNDGTIPVKIIEDDGQGNLTALYSGILSTTTGEESTVNYINSTITINWNTSYLAGFTNNPYIRFKYISETKEEHVEMLDWLGEVFQYFKTNELDAQLLYYNPEQIPTHQLDTLASDHNWILDRFYSEDESYLRRQLSFLYSLYKSKRTLDSIYFAISIIGKRINFYNLMAEKNYYDDYSKYVLFDVLTLFKDFNDANPGTDQETVASQIQALYNDLYAPSSDYYPTKHFLLDLALDTLHSDNTLLNEIDLPTLKTYILKTKAKTQYPHFQAYLGIEADAALTQQDSSTFLFKLTEGEQLFSVTEYRTLYTGPDSVYSIAQFASGAWVILPLRMNTGYSANSGLNANMTLGDVENYLTYFKVGKDNYDTLTIGLENLKDPFYTSSNMTIIYDEDYYYMTLTLDENVANAYPIKEVGVFNDQDKLAFYIKHPEVQKTDSHKMVYRLKLKVNGYI